MLNTLIPKGSAALGEAQHLFWKPKTKGTAFCPCQESASAKHNSCSWFLTLKLNLLTFSTVGKKKFKSLRFTWALKHPKSRTNHSLTYALISLARILLFSFFVREGFWKQNVGIWPKQVSKNWVWFQSLPAGWLQSLSSSHRINPMNSVSWVLLLLQDTVLPFSQGCNCTLQEFSCQLSLKQGIFANGGFLYTTQQVQSSDRARIFYSGITAAATVAYKGKTQQSETMGWVLQIIWSQIPSNSHSQGFVIDSVLISLFLRRKNNSFLHPFRDTEAGVFLMHWTSKITGRDMDLYNPNTCRTFYCSQERDVQNCVCESSIHLNQVLTRYECGK